LRRISFRDVSVSFVIWSLFGADNELNFQSK
jgi:hypothetical protein